MTRPTAQQGLQWLAEQGERMNELRNGTTRDPGFREWRQNTLTMLQRLWPGQPARAQRFKRVPFAPPSARATDQEARECFERGFAEARKLLKMWEAELKHVGTEGVDPEAGSVPDEPPIGNAEMAPDVPTVTLGPRARSQGPLPSKAGPRPPAEKPAAPPKARSKPRQQLRDMLGLGELQDPRLAEPAPPAESPRTSRRASPRLADSAIPAGAPRRKPEDLVSAAGPDALGRSIADALAHARAVTPPAPLGDLEIRRGFEEVGATPVSRAATPSQAFAGLIAELERLGVPPEERSRVGMALAELGAHLDQGAVSWESMRETMALVMTCPALARRAVPILLAHFDAAA